jgi:Cache domain
VLHAPSVRDSITTGGRVHEDSQPDREALRPPGPRPGSLRGARANRSARLTPVEEDRRPGGEGRGAGEYPRQGAFDELRKKGSEWFDGETYLFAYDGKGNVILNPAFPKREGTNVSGQTDANGKRFHDLMLETARTKGAGWVDYMFPRAGQTAPSHKWTYVKRVTIDGAPALLGTGFYPD